MKKDLVGIPAQAARVGLTARVWIPEKERVDFKRGGWYGESEEDGSPSSPTLAGRDLRLRRRSGIEERKAVK